MALVLVLMLAAGPGSALAEWTYSNYVGGEFIGADPWEGALTVEVLSIENGRMAWRLTDIYDGATFKRLITNTELTEGAGTFRFTDAAAEDVNLIVSYTGAIRLVNGRVCLSFLDGQAYELSPEGGSGYHMAQALDESARTVTLTRVAE